MNAPASNNRFSGIKRSLLAVAWTHAAATLLSSCATGISRFISAYGVVLAAALTVLVASCTTARHSDGSDAARDITTSISPRWKMASRTPLVFHPADSGSDSVDGNWIAAGDAWFFIPQHGLSHDARMALITETFDLRKKFGAPTDPTPPKMAGRDNGGEPGQQAGNAALGLYGKAVGGMGQAAELTMFSLMLMGWPFVGADPGS